VKTPTSWLEEETGNKILMCLVRSWKWDFEQDRWIIDCHSTHKREKLEELGAL